MKTIYLIELEQPKGVSITEMQDYIMHAVNMWGGQYCHDDPLHSMNWNNNVKVTRATSARMTRVLRRWL